MAFAFPLIHSIVSDSFERCFQILSGVDFLHLLFPFKVSTDAG